MKTHKEYLDKQLSDKKFADGFYREKRKLKMNKEATEKVNAMTDKELRITAAELMGDKIVHTEWPCGYSPDACGLEVDGFPLKIDGEFVTDSPDWFDRRWPVKELVPGAYWPPQEPEDGDDKWYTVLVPVPDYPNDIAAAMKLFEELCKMRTNCTIHVSNGAVCTCWDVLAEHGRDFENPISGESDWEEDIVHAICRAITRAFIIAMESKDANV